MKQWYEVMNAIICIGMLEHSGAGPIAGEDLDQSRPDQILPVEGRGVFRSPPPLDRASLVMLLDRGLLTDRANLVVPAAWAVSGRWWVT